MDRRALSAAAPVAGGSYGVQFDPVSLSSALMKVGLAVEAHEGVLLTRGELQAIGVAFATATSLLLHDLRVPWIAASAAAVRDAQAKGGDDALPPANEGTYLLAPFASAIAGGLTAKNGAYYDRAIERGRQGLRLLGDCSHDAPIPGASYLTSTSIVSPSPEIAPAIGQVAAGVVFVAVVGLILARGAWTDYQGAELAKADRYIEKDQAIQLAAVNATLTAALEQMRIQQAQGQAPDPTALNNIDAILKATAPPLPSPTGWAIVGGALGFAALTAAGIAGYRHLQKKGRASPVSALRRRLA